MSRERGAEVLAIRQRAGGNTRDPETQGRTWDWEKEKGKRKEKEDFFFVDLTEDLRVRSSWVGVALNPTASVLYKTHGRVPGRRGKAL